MEAASAGDRPAAVSATREQQSTGKKPKKQVTDRARSERKLAWMLCAPAVIAMLLVTAYPIIYAFVLSLQRVDLRFPDEGGFVGLANYGDVLTSSLWWQDVANTVGLTVVSVAIEFVLGMAIALLMHRAIFGRGTVRTSVLIPYGIVTVVAAFSWQFAFQPDTGWVNQLPVRRRRQGLVRRALQRLLRDHPRRGLEDDAVHRAAPARRADDDRRRPL